MIGKVPGGARPARAAVTLPPVLILLLGLLTTAVCMLLLFGPFYPEHASPGATLQRALRPLSEHLPRPLRLLMGNRFLLVMLLVFGVFLALKPWRNAVHRRDARFGASPQRAAGISSDLRVTRTEHDVSFTFSDDGSIVSDHGDGELTRSVPDLREMAAATGIPWHTDFETEGGSRAFLEVLRALHDGPAGVFRAEDHEGTATTPQQAAARPSSAAPEPAPSAAPGPLPSAAPEPAPSAARGAVPPVSAAASVPGPFRDDAPGRGGAESTDSDRAENAAADRSGGYRLTEPTWSSSYSSSVYTSTDLYRSARTDPATPDDVDPGDMDSTDSSEDTAGER